MLKLLNANIAANYGTPQSDCDYEETVREMKAQGWSEPYARAHLDAAIRAGAYERAVESAASKERARKQEK